MIDYELLLFDRISVIKEMDKKLDLSKNAYLSFSGGKDSTVLSWLLDIALPGNNIARVYSDTGIEFLDIREFVQSFCNVDDRFIMLKPSMPIKMTLETFGYPFKSKIHSHILHLYQTNGLTKSCFNYLNNPKYFHGCPNVLKYQFTSDFSLKVSDLCCYKMKEEPLTRYALSNNKNVAITGILADEDGRRKNAKCILSKGRFTFFNPFAKVPCSFVDWLVDKFSISLCRLYYPPFNFVRTGCKGCPFALELQKELTLMDLYLPNERLQCELIWKPVYSEYRRLNYRLARSEQLRLF